LEGGGVSPGSQARGAQGDRQQKCDERTEMWRLGRPQHRDRPDASGDIVLAGLQKEIADDRRHLLGPRNQNEVPVIYCDQTRIGDQVRENAPVYHWNDRVVGSHHDQRRLPQPMQPMHAGPAGAGKKLIEVAEAAGRGEVPAVRGEQVRLVPKSSAVERAAYFRHVARIKISPRRHQLRQDANSTRRRTLIPAEAGQ
jgi:hypothetical protein